MGEEVILAKLDGISQRQDETNRHLRALNGKVAEHERWIRERDGIISRTDARLLKLELDSAAHQSYIDQRQQDLKDFAIMKATQAEHQAFIERYKGGRSATAQLVMQALTLIGIAVSIYAAVHGKG